MSEKDRERWEARWRARARAGGGKGEAGDGPGGEGGRGGTVPADPVGSPSPFIAAWASRWPGDQGWTAPGPALDLACGAGRHALLLARLGYEVEAVDISSRALELGRGEAARRGLEIRWREADLDALALPAAAWQLVVVSQFLDRRLMPELVECLRPGGLLLYEQHLLSQVPVRGPAERRFRARPNELLRLCAPLRVLEYRECLERDPADPEALPRAVARLAACAPPAPF